MPKVVKISWTGNPFADMSEKDKEIFNLGMNLMGMDEDHPSYETDLARLNHLLEED